MASNLQLHTRSVFVKQLLSVRMNLSCCLILTGLVQLLGLRRRSSFCLSLPEEGLETRIV